MNETAQVRLTDRKMIRRLSKYMKGNVWKFIFAGLLMLLSVALNLLLPYLLGKAARLLGEANDYREILLTVLLYALCMAMVFVFQYFQAIILQKPARTSSLESGKMSFRTSKPFPQTNLQKPRSENL